MTSFRYFLGVIMCLTGGQQGTDDGHINRRLMATSKPHSVKGEFVRMLTLQIIRCLSNATGYKISGKRNQLCFPLSD